MGRWSSVFKGSGESPRLDGDGRESGKEARRSALAPENRIKVYQRREVPQRKLVEHKDGGKMRVDDVYGGTPAVGLARPRAGHRDLARPSWIGRSLCLRGRRTSLLLSVFKFKSSYALEDSDNECEPSSTGETSSIQRLDDSSSPSKKEKSHEKQKPTLPVDFVCQQRQFFAEVDSFQLEEESPAQKTERQFFLEDDSVELKEEHPVLKIEYDEALYACDPLEYGLHKPACTIDPCAVELESTSAMEGDMPHTCSRPVVNSPWIARIVVESPVGQEQGPRISQGHLLGGSRTIEESSSIASKTEGEMVSYQADDQPYSRERRNPLRELVTNMALPQLQSLTPAYSTRTSESKVEPIVGNTRNDDQLDTFSRRLLESPCTATLSIESPVREEKQVFVSRGSSSGGQHGDVEIVEETLRVDTPAGGTLDYQPSSQPRIGEQQVFLQGLSPNVPLPQIPSTFSKDCEEEIGISSGSIGLEELTPQPQKVPSSSSLASSCKSPVDNEEGISAADSTPRVELNDPASGDASGEQRNPLPELVSNTALPKLYSVTPAYSTRTSESKVEPIVGNTRNDDQLDTFSRRLLESPCIATLSIESPVREEKQVFVSRGSSSGGQEGDVGNVEETLRVATPAGRVLDYQPSSQPHTGEQQVFLQELSPNVPLPQIPGTFSKYCEEEVEISCENIGLEELTPQPQKVLSSSSLASSCKSPVGNEEGNSAADITPRVDFNDPAAEGAINAGPSSLEKVSNQSSLGRTPCIESTPRNVPLPQGQSMSPGACLEEIEISRRISELEISRKISELEKSTPQTQKNLSPSLLSSSHKSSVGMKQGSLAANAAPKLELLNPASGEAINVGYVSPKLASKLSSFRRTSCIIQIKSTPGNRTTQRRSVLPDIAEEHERIIRRISGLRLSVSQEQTDLLSSSGLRHTSSVVKEENASAGFTSILELLDPISGEALDLGYLSPSTVSKISSNGRTSVLVEKLCPTLDNLLLECKQEAPTSLQDAIMEFCGHNEIEKLGEGTYGEAFGGGDLCFKIVPMDGDFLVNGEVQKNMEEMLNEVLVTKAIAKLREGGSANICSNFIETKGVRICRGRYEPFLVEAWEQWDLENKSENDHPMVFPDKQLYVVFVFSNGGRDLEHYALGSYKEVQSLLLQVVLALATAENACGFEHRDLHWGNVLIAQTEDDVQACRLNGRDLNVRTFGINVNIIDFTLSRLQNGGHVLFNDLSLDPEIFKGPARHVQFETYRRMRTVTGGAWEQSFPKTNTLWIHYLADILLNSKTYPCTKAEKHQLRAFRKQALKYDSATATVEDEFFANLMVREP